MDTVLKFLMILAFADSIITHTVPITSGNIILKENDVESFTISTLPKSGHSKRICHDLKLKMKSVNLEKIISLSVSPREQSEYSRILFCLQILSNAPPSVVNVSSGNCTRSLRKVLSSEDHASDERSVEVLSSKQILVEDLMQYLHLKCWTLEEVSDEQQLREQLVDTQYKKYCGAALSNKLSEMCKTYPVRTAKRLRRGVSTDCCRTHCNLRTLAQYCDTLKAPLWTFVTLPGSTPAPSTTTPKTVPMTPTPRQSQRKLVDSQVGLVDKPENFPRLASKNFKCYRRLC